MIKHFGENAQSPSVLTAASHRSFTEINLPHIYLAARGKREGEVEAVEVAQRGTLQPADRSSTNHTWNKIMVIPTNRQNQ